MVKKAKGSEYFPNAMYGIAPTLHLRPPPTLWLHVDSGVSPLAENVGLYWAQSLRSVQSSAADHHQNPDYLPLYKSLRWTFL